MTHSTLFTSGSFGKWALAITLTVLSWAPALAQQGVGIGTTAPDVSAALDIVSSTKGALLPRVALATALATPATGLLVFQTGAPAGFYYNAGTPGAPSWQQIATAAGVAVTASNGLTKTGNNIALGGTLGGATAIAQAGNVFSLTGGNVGIGTSSPAGLFTVEGHVLAATAALDQQQTNYEAEVGDEDQWQSFTVGVSGNLTQIDMLVKSPTGANGAPGTLSVYAGQGTSGTLLTTQAIVYNVVPFGSYQVYPLTTPVPVVAGQQYTYRFTTAPNPFVFVGMSSSATYAGGIASLGAGGSPSQVNAYDFCFKTYVAALVGRNVLTALAGGNVGIGTTAPTQPLEVAGQVYSSAGGFRFPDNTIQTTAAIATPATTASNGLNKAGNNIALGGPLTGATNIAQAGNTFSLTGGSVGIGTTAPTQALEVAGQVFSSTGGFRFPDNTVQTTAATNATASNGLTKAGNNVVLGGPLTQATSIAQAGNVFSLTGGNVGIGTSSPAGLLTVQGSGPGPATLDQQQLISDANGGGTDYWQSFTAGTSGSLTRLDLLVGSPSGANGAPGTLSVYAGQGTGGALLTTQAIVYNNVSNTYQQYPLTTPVAVVAGQQYSYRFQTPSFTSGFLYLALSNPYAGGQSSVSGSYDLCFKTYVSQTLTTNVLTALTGGNVGIGTTAPSQALEVTGQVFSSTGGFRFPDNSVQTTAATTSSASNGLTKTGNNVVLGGTLSQATTIVQAGNTFSLTGTAVGAGALDQQQLAVTSGQGNADSWQSFTAGTSGNLTQIDMRVTSPTNANGAPGTLSIYAGQGIGGTLLTTQAIIYNKVANTYQQYPLATPVAVVAGQQYTYRFQTPTITVAFVDLSTANPYAGGQSNYSSASDFCFKTYVAPLSTTSALTVLGGGNVGIGTASPTQALEVAGTVFSTTGGFQFPDNTIQTTAATATPPVTASNGLTKTGNNVVLGGTLTGATTIAQAGNNFSLTDGNVGIGTSSPVGLLTVQGSAPGAGVVDQQQLSGTSSGGGADNWQSFTAGVSGVLTQLDLRVGSPSGANGAPGTLSVYAGEGTGGTLLTTQAIVYNQVGFSTYQPYPLTTPVAVLAGQQYTYRFQAPNITFGFVTYSDANLYAGGRAGSSGVRDFSFKTYVASLLATTPLTVLASGNVGIGTTMPTQPLEVAGTVFSTAGGFKFPDGTTQTTAATTNPATTASNGLTKTGNNVALGGTLTGATTIAQAGNNFSLTGGNVGIGTSAPNVRLSITPSATEPKITLWDGGVANATSHYGFGISGGQLNYHLDGTAASHVFYAGGRNGDGSELLRIQGNGNVSVSGELRTQNAYNRLRRGTTPYTTSDLFDGGSGGVHISNSESEEGGFWANGDYAAIYSPGDNDLVKFLDEDGFNNAGTAYDGVALRARIDDNGQYFQVSDAKAKHDITPIADGLRKLLSLSGYTYAFSLLPHEAEKGQKPQRAAGVLAQEVERVLPEAVSQQDGHYMVNYAALAPLFIQAIKQLKAENDALKQQASQTTATLISLADRLRALEAGSEQARK